MKLPLWIQRGWQFLTSKSPSVAAGGTAPLVLIGLIIGYVADITAAAAAIGLIGLTALPILTLGAAVLHHELKKPAAEKRRRNTIGGCVLIMVALAAVAPRLWTAMSQTPSQAAGAAPAASPPTQPSTVQQPETHATTAPLTKKTLPRNLPGPNFDIEFLASELHGWQKYIDTSPSVALQFVAEYDNTGSVQQDNVTLRFELPSELVYQPNTTRLGHAHHPDGIQTNDITNGLNIGSYGPGGGAWVLFSATLKDERAFLCDTRTLVPEVRAEADSETKSAEVTLKVKRRC